MSVEANASTFPMVNEASEDVLVRKKRNRFKREREKIRNFKDCKSKGYAGIDALPPPPVRKYTKVLTKYFLVIED